MADMLVEMDQRRLENDRGLAARVDVALRKRIKRRRTDVPTDKRPPASPLKGSTELLAS
jgi:hypothetical protein